MGYAPQFEAPLFSKAESRRLIVERRTSPPNHRQLPALIHAFQQGRGVEPGRTPRFSPGQTRLESSCPSFGIRNLFRRRYADECGAAGFGFFRGGGISVPCARRDLSEAALPRFAIRQRENSWQYLASSRAASLWANTCSGDNSGRESDAMYTSMGNPIIPSNP
jgi:hypothetical protein